MIVICAKCGNTFSKKPSDVRVVNYCNKKCMEKRLSVECMSCGKIVTRPVSQMLNHVFCSRKCAKGFTSAHMFFLQDKRIPKEKRDRDHQLYQTWNGLKVRCLVPTNRDYKNYGGRGIKVCERWRVSFHDFVSDMGLKPTPKHTIERINNDGHYEPDNCRWATKAEQNRNKRNVKKI